MVRGARRAGLDPDEMMSLGMWAIVGALIGAKALLAIRSPQDYLTSLSALRSLVSSAGDFYGGFIGALIASAIFFRRHPQLPFWRAGGRLRAGDRARSGDWTHRLLHGRRRLRPAGRRCPGR